MWTFWFYDEITGEEFFVEALDEMEATDIAYHYFEKPIFREEVSMFEAECMGYDTYQKGDIKMDLEDILAVLLEDCEIDDILIEEYDDFFIIEA